MRSWLAVAFAATAAVVLGISPGRSGLPHARAATMWSVQVGGSGDEAAGIDMNAFLPRNLTITAGDTVSWEFQGFHTVTFNAGMAPPAFVVPGPSTGELSFGPAFGPIGTPGPYDGATQVSSGAPADEGPPEPFVLTFTNSGVFSYVCMIHPGQAGTITVLPAGSTPPETPEQATTRGQAEAEAAKAQLSASIGQVSSAATTAGTTTVHSAVVGLSNPFGATALRMLPDAISVKRGDVVNWTMADPFEVHTVTFLSGGAKPDFPDVRPAPAGPPQLVILANIAGPSGGTTYTGSGYLNSGLMFAGASFGVRFEAPAGTYEYLCLVHPDMKGTITVTE